LHRPPIFAAWARANRPWYQHEMPKKRSPTRARARGAVRSQPLLAVRDVQASSRWYARLLGAERLSAEAPSDHDHVYDRVMSGPLLVLQLHAWDEEDHPNLVHANAAPPGHGVLVWFEVHDFDAAVKRARALKARVVRKPHVNPAAQHRELWLRDRDGYVVVLAGPDGEAR